MLLSIEEPQCNKEYSATQVCCHSLQIVDVNSSELDWLARHMGHNISVHREYYRLHDSTLELAKVGKVLLAVDEGNSLKWLGRNLDQIQLDGKLLKNFLKAFLLQNDTAPNAMTKVKLCCEVNGSS